MNEWISISDRLPNPMQDVLIKTDCQYCPVIPMMFYKDKFFSQVIVQCDHHYETDEKFAFLKVDPSFNTLENFCDRITHWMPLPNPPEEI